MTLKEFNELMILAAFLRGQARQLMAKADNLDDLACRLAGVRHVDREPGFPCWTVDGVGWFYTPDAAVQAKDAQQAELDKQVKESGNQS